MAIIDDAARALRGVRSGGPVPGAPSIPVGEATELDGASARSAIRSATGAPPTPATGVGGSAEAQAFRAGQAANIGPQQAGAQIEGVGTRMANAARPVVAQAGEFATGARAAVNGVAGKAVGGLAAGQAILDGMAPDSTERYAQRFGVDAPSGDGSIGDIAKFAALRAGGFASDLGNNLTLGLASKLYTDTPGQGTRAASTAVMAPKPTVAPSVVPAAQPAGVAAPTDPANVVNRQGNSFSGGTVREGFTYTGDGAPAGARGPIGVVPGYDGSRDAATSAALRGQVEAQRTLDGYAAGPQGGGAGSLGGKPGGARDLSQYTPAELQFLAQEANNQTAVRGQDIQAGNAAAQLAQSRYHTDVGAAVSTRGQDMNNQVARAQARIEQMQKDRTFQLDVAKFGQDQATANFNQREAADKNVTAKLEALNPGDDGKPNAAAVATQKQYLNRGLADLGADGFHQLGPQAQEQLLSATKLLSRIKEDGGLAPWKPDLLKTVSPADLIGMEFDKGRDSYVITRKGSRALGQTIPARYFKREDAGYFFGAPTNQYDNLTRGVRDDGR